MSDDVLPKLPYLVWYDPFFEEWFVCPEQEVTPAVLSCLAQMHTAYKRVEATSSADALDAIRPKNKVNSSLDFDDDLPHLSPAPVRRSH